MAAEQIKVVLGIESLDEAAHLGTELEASGEALVCATVTNGSDLVCKAKSIKPQVIISDIILPEIDGLSAFSILKKLGIRAKFIAISEFFSHDIFNESVKIGVSALVKKPYNAKLLAEKAIFYAAGESKNDIFEREITDFLHKIGVPTNVSGYRYLREAILSASEDIGRVNGITKILYPDIAKKFGTTGARVERAIRHAIGLAWRKDGILQEMFGDEKPTNSEFISMIADDLRSKKYTLL